MLSKKLQDAFNEQINREFFSEYLYLSMSAWCKSGNMDGIGNYFHVQAQEEHQHAMKFFNFIHDRGGTVTLKALDAPQSKFKSLIEIFEQTLEHEQFITKSINTLMSTALKEDDHAAVSFLKWFIDEQVEEEASVSKILHKIKLIKGEGHGLLMIDAELGQRKFTPDTGNNE
ncbi:MAG TPA: ferritin [bacterium]|nr:ferritin [bacterium]HMW35282.1 ferritin [bacterium]HMY35984.1 ferritin [bacterium]HMZ04858.1 ferritin [bacterium]HNB56212.1 ferritin [bacterium]